MRRRILKIIVLSVVSLLLLEALSYVVFRVAFHERFSFAGVARLKQQRISAATSAQPATPDVDPAATVPHPYLGFVYNPRNNPEGMRALHTVPVSDWGFLDDKSPLQPAAKDEVVVGIFGGSVAFWFSVQGLDAMLEELAKIPQFRGKRFVVVRTALGGSKQPQQLMALSYLLALGGHFDVLINLDGFNEIALAPGWLIPKEVFPFFPRGWPELLGEAGDPELSRLIGRVLYLEELAGDRARQFSGPIASHSVFANTIWRALDNKLAGELARARAELEAHKPESPAERRNYAAVGPRRQYRNPQEMYQDLVAFWRESSLQMHRLCRANGILYFHFLQPNQYLEGTKPMSEGERKAALWPGSSFERDVRAGYPLMSEAGRALAAQGVAFSDLTRVFDKISEPLYTDTCCHFSVEGNRILGHAMGREIAAAMAKTKG